MKKKKTETIYDLIGIHKTADKLLMSFFFASMVLGGFGVIPKSWSLYLATSALSMAIYILLHGIFDNYGKNRKTKRGNS